MTPGRLHVMAIEVDRGVPRTWCGSVVYDVVEVVLDHMGDARAVDAAGLLFRSELESVGADAVDVS